jgi:type IV secretion system protein VirD4
MNATKILWGQVLVVSAVVLAFVWGATEWVASRLAFQTELGSPWFELLGFPVYHPPAFFWWWFVYDAYARDIFVEGAYIAASGGIAAVIVAIAISVWRAREVKRATTYGSARWAEAREVRRPASLATMEHSSGDGETTICATTVRSMCCVSHRPDQARGSGLSSPRC